MISVEINRSSVFDSIPQSAIRNPQWGNGFIHFLLEADGFLYNMARAIVGTLLEVGRGKITPDEFKRILESKNRRLAGETVPAKGLCLMEVKY